MDSDTGFLKHYKELLHEIKSPIGIIRAHALHLKENYKREPECIDEYLSIILDEAERLDRFLRDVDISIKEPELKLSLCDVKSLITDVTGKLKYELEKKDVSVTHHFSRELKEIYLDRHKFISILINLVENAVDSVSEGGTVEISAEIDDLFYLTVKDDGCGIDEAGLKKVFTPFYSTKPEGAGLGLYIVKRLVAAHGGNINISSGPGSGSEFMLSFPVRVNEGI